MAKGKHSNLLEMTPRRVQEWQDGEDGRVRILVPRYGAHRLGRWMAARMGSKAISVRLDHTGSMIWHACDGKRTVGEITHRIRQQVENDSDDMMERVARYFRELEVSKFIKWR